MKNTKLVINICELIPEEWTTKEVDENLIKVFYVNKGRGNNPFPITIPKKSQLQLSLLKQLQCILVMEN